MPTFYLSFFFLFKSILCLRLYFYHLFPVCVLQCAAYCSGVELHLELLQVEPLLGLAGIQVMVEVSCCVAKTVEFSVWSEQDCGGSFLIGHPRVSALPAPGGEKSCSILTDWMVWSDTWWSVHKKSYQCKIQRCFLCGSSILEWNECWFKGV